MAIHIDVLARIRERQVQREADKMADQFDRTGAEASERFGSAFERGMARQSPKIQRSFNAVADATARVRKEQYDYDKMVASGHAGREELAIQADRIASARRREADAHRSAAGAIRQFNDASRGTKRGINDLDIGVSSLNLGFINLGKSAATLATTALPGLFVVAMDTAKAVLTASRSIALIPALAATAGAGMGTLALATQGFGDAIKDIRDPEKFAEDLALLGPNAQQAALSLRNLLPEFDKLRMATSDAFFAGIGEQIHTLANQYLPTIQNLTTSIAGSFNQMMMNVANQLMTPESQQQIAGIFGNIEQAFTNLVPAANSFTQALLDITSAGSDFLPELATGIANAAANFADFIREARQSGELRVWIQEGIDAVKVLGQAVFEIGKMLYQVFDSDGRQNIENFKQTAARTIEVLTDIGKAIDWLDKILRFAFVTPGEVLGSIPTAAALAANAFSTAANAMKDAFINGPIKVVNMLINALNSLARSKAMQFLMPGIAADIPNIPEVPDIPMVNVPQMPGQIRLGGNGGGTSPTPGQTSTGIVGSNGQIYTPVDKGTPGAVPIPGKNQWGTPGASTSRSSIDRQRDIPPEELPGAGLGPYGGPFDVPAPPAKDASGNKLSDKERRDQIIAGLDPSLWKVDPFAPVPGAGDMSGLPGGLMPGGIPIGGDTQETLEAQHRVISEAHDLEEARKDRLALEKDNTATQHDIDEAKWKELEAGWNLQKAQADLAEKSRGTTRDLKQGMDELGAALDPDFGLSKGLAGLAENLTKMIGNMAAAPFLAKLQGIVDANKAATGIEGGYGLMGIRGAQNMAMGLSPILGNPMFSAMAGGTGSSSLIAALGATMPSILNDTGSVPSGPQSRAAAALIQQYFGSQLRGKIGGSRDENTAKGTHDTGTSIDIPIGPDQGALGDQIRDFLQANAGALGLKYTIWRNLGQNVGGGTFNQPGHMDHIDAHFSGQGLPVSIQNVQPSALSGAGPTLWDAVMPHEGGTWNNRDTGNNGHYGGLQFTPATWAAFGGTQFAQNPADATREQQIEIANRTAFTGFNGTPPQGLSAWEAITNGSVPGVTVNTPASAFMGGTGNTWQTGMPLGLPTMGGAGQGPLLGGPTPMGVGTGIGQLGAGPFGLGGAPGLGASATAGLNNQTTQYGGSYGTPGLPGGGGVGITPGGTLDTAMSLAGSALDVLAPGAGQAAQTGIKLANRAIQYAGQLAGIGVQGLMETFLPTGGSDLANNSWLTRLAGAAAGAIPAIPNIAGGKGGKDGQQPLTPEQAQQYLQGQGQQTNVTNNVEYNNIGATEDRAGADLTHHLTKGYQGPGPG